MHDHDSNDKGMGTMVWMMVICCGLPLALIFLFGVGGRALGAPLWVIGGAMALMVILHFFIMKRQGQNSEDKHAGHDTADEVETKKDKTQSGHGCCH